MRDFLTLYFALICGRLSLDSFFGGGKLKKAAASVLIAVFVVFFFVTFLWLFIPLTRAAHDMEYPALAMEVGVLVSVVPCFWFGFFGVIRNLCFAGDILILAHLPVRRICIFRSKTVFVYTCSLFFCGMVMLPALAVYSAIVGGGVFFWLRGIAVIFLLPVVPMTAGTLLAFLISLIPGNGKNLSAVSKYASMLIIPVMDAAMAVLCIFSGDKGEKVGQFLADHWAALKVWSIPPFSWAAISVCGGGMTSVITALLLCIAVLICWMAVIWILRAMFVRRVSKVLSSPADRAMR